MIRKILRPILISIIQILGLAIIHDCLNHFYPIQHKSVGFAITTFYTALIFILSILIFNFYLEFFKKNIFLIAFSLFILVSIFPLEAIQETPLRSLFLITLAIFGFLSSLILNKLKTKNQLKP